MKIMSQVRKIELKNIKAIENFDVSFLDDKKLILLIGHNNSGKTSILEAIKLFFSDEKNAAEFWPLNSDGTYKELTESPYILVEIEYTAEEIENLKSELSKTKQNIKLEEHLIGNKLIIRKPLQKDSSNKIQAKILECKCKDGKNFKNFTGITQVLSKFLPRFVYLPSIASLDDYQSASERAQHNFEELFEIYFEGLRWEEDDEIKKMVSDLVKKIDSKIGISDIQQQLEKFLEEIDNIKIADLRHGFQGVSDVGKLIKKVKVSLNDGIISEATLKGSGTQRAFIFCLLRLIAEQRRNKLARDTIFLIDEPDLYLHPQLQKQMRIVLEKLSENYPVIISTHSHLMIPKKLTIKGVIKKIYREDNTVKVEEISDKEKLFRELFTYLGYIPSDFLLPDNIILVEGKHDKQFLDKVKELIIEEHEENKDAKNEYDISVIDIGGDGQAKKAMSFFRDLPSAVSFFQGLPAYKDRFCGLFDKSRERSLIDLRNKANDNNEPYRINCLDKNGIEYYYPLSLLKAMNKEVDDIVKSNEEKSKAADYISSNLTKDHLKEIDDKITNLIKLAFQKAKII